MAAHFLLRALSDGKNGGADETNIIVRSPKIEIGVVTRRGRKSRISSGIASRLEDDISSPRRPKSRDSDSNLPLKRQKTAHFATQALVSPDTDRPSPDIVQLYTTQPQIIQPDVVLPKIVVWQPDASQSAEPTASAQGDIKNSATDKNITDTIARIHHYLEDKSSFNVLSGKRRRATLKGLKSSFGNRYKGRCTDSERREYIIQWVKLAGIHNELVASESEKRALRVQIDSRYWLEQDVEAIAVD